jgi:IS5 family transposase
MDNQLNFLAIGWKKKVLKSERFLKEMDVVVPWKRLVALIEPHYADGRLGRKPFPLELMLRVYCLQQWFNLSDPAAEEAIYDRNSFQRFLSLDIVGQNVPDETTILNFRHGLETHRLTEAIFAEIGAHLAQKGLTMKTGTIVDATLIAAPSSTKNAAGKRDEQMSSTRKGNQWHFGMKASVGVDAASGLVHSVATTTASVHDSQVMEAVLHGQEKVLLGDKGYANDAGKRQARARGICWGILDRAKQGHPLSGKQQSRNRHWASVRAKVEHPFRVLKCQWGYRKVRYRGLAKNTAQLWSLFGLANVYLARKKLLALA